MHAAVRIHQNDIRVQPRMAVAALRFSNATLHNALGLLCDLSGSWIQGVDDANTLAVLTLDLDLYVGILENGDDLDVRDRATATLRRISAIFVRDLSYGLVRTGGHDADALAHPDLHEANA